MQLYNFDPSPNPLKVRLALAELGLDYENKEIVLFKGEQRRPEYLGVNPEGKVPVLIDGDLTLRESNAILSYLGREYGTARGLWPSDPKSESLALQWLFFESAQCTKNFGSIWFNTFALPQLGREVEDDSALENEIKGARWCLKQLERHLKENSFMLGDRFTLVDCSLGAAVAMLHDTILKDSEEWPGVRHYLDQVVSQRVGRVRVVARFGFEPPSSFELGGSVGLNTIVDGLSR